ncbi:MAG: hypothetical protein M1142_04690 [Patescibacteria group bacterium]|nr:hypothetical protein [Patescibacteria group bacterium]
MNTNNQTLVKSLERDITNLLLYKLEHLEITPERAALIAQFTLVHLPENLTDEQLKQILPALDDEFIELAGIIHQYMNKFEEETKQKIAQDAQALIKSGHFDKASTMMREYFKRRLP